MGKHAVIEAGLNEFGNARHKMAPRVRVTERVTGTAQQDKFDRLAGTVVRFKGIEGVTHDGHTTADKLAAALAGRRVTQLTENMTRWRKEGSKFTLTLRGVGGKLVARKTNTKSFNGWLVEYIVAGGKQSILVAAVPKGSSINTNGEREDACRAGLNTLQLILRKIS
jgi:hypothetical protein